MIPKLTMKTFLKILFAPLFWLIQACSPLGNPVDEEISNNHYYNKKKTDINYSSMGNWFELGNSPMHAHVESFEVLTRFISRDKNRAYYMNNPIEYDGFNLEKLYVKKGDYLEDIAFDNTNVYSFEKVYGDNKPAKIKVVAQANPETYTRTDYDWSQDDTKRFYKHQLIQVDYDSFENINRTFSRDNQKAYVHYEEHFAPIEADVRQFKVLDDGYFAMDSLHVFSMTFTNDQPNGTKLVSIPKTADEEVSLLSEVFLKIGERIFYRGSQLPDLDSNSIEIVGFFYIKDKNTVYYKDTKLNDADAATFSKKGKWNIGDKNGLFQEGKRIQK